ncbi:uncharacterized protein YALI1_C25742g [Yarrowia lipolytica]|uniref:Uncharacterized protein n=1 Tax=Yarrowia lipolytica TaxID=4952 RepID=A0A1D8NBN8_YARLL|nr:hypothetical protein YALI1_C25742g [Yarrowia lipolytica]
MFQHRLMFAVTQALIRQMTFAERDSLVVNSSGHLDMPIALSERDRIKHMHLERRKASSGYTRIFCTDIRPCYLAQNRQTLLQYSSLDFPAA